MAKIYWFDKWVKKAIREIGEPFPKEVLKKIKEQSNAGHKPSATESNGDRVA